MKKMILFLLLVLSQAAFGENSYPTRDSVHIFWQPNLKITFEDYKGDTITAIMDTLRKYNISATACVGIWSVLDIPKKESQRGDKLEKVYFAPAFDRTTSFTLTNDTLQIEMQNIYLDICEIWARWARHELQKFQDTTINAYGVLTSFYMTVKQDMDKARLASYADYFTDVFINKTVGAFKEWREIIDKTLEQSKQWATKPEECYRFIKNEPIEKGYIMAPNVTGPLHDSKD